MALMIPKQSLAERKSTIVRLDSAQRTACSNGRLFIARDLRNEHDTLRQDNDCQSFEDWQSLHINNEVCCTHS